MLITIMCLQFRMLNTFDPSGCHFKGKSHPHISTKKKTKRDLICYNYISMVSKANKNNFSVNYKNVGRQFVSFV
jgi:hypothetical protein